MSKQSKKGFTIIEVVLVLAVAGLIFLMVFIALPALQRSQRNTQRRNDYSMLVTSIVSYMSSNNGKITNLIKNSAATTLTASRWINSTGEDPNGNPYELTAYTYKLWTQAGSPAPKGADSSNNPVSQVFVIIKANCNETDADGDPKPDEDSAARAFAVYGYLEGGGYFCQASGSAD